MAQKWAVLAVLLLLPVCLVEAHSRVSVEAGHEAVLSCPNTSKVPLVMVTWKRSCSSCCLLSHRSDHNMTRRENCSERITWKYSSVSDPVLRIYPVNLGDEGNYSCEIANTEGNFHSFSSLTVIVPPMVTLTQDKSRVAVCQASAGKPPADISWIPASNHSSEEEFHHPNGTVTRVSYFGWANSSFPSLTCLVTHPATNQTLVMDLRVGSPWLAARCPPSCSIAPPSSTRHGEKYNGQLVGQDTSHWLLYTVIGPAAAGVGAVIGLTLCLIFKCRACRLCKQVRGPAEHFTTNTWNFPPSRARREAAKPPDFPEQIYENYHPKSIYVCL